MNQVHASIRPFVLRFLEENGRSARTAWVFARSLLVFCAVLFLTGFLLPPDTLETIQLLPIQHNGRIKPFDSFARETVKFMTGQEKIHGQRPMDSILSMIAEPEQWQDRPVLDVPFLPLREALGLTSKTTHVSYNQLIETKKLMRMLPSIVQKQQKQAKISMLEQETLDLYERFVTFNSLITHQLFLVPPLSGDGMEWRRITQPQGYSSQQQTAFQNSWEEFILAYREHRADAPEKVRNLSALLQSANSSAYPAPWKLRLELFYNRSSFFHKARILYLLAICGLLVGLLRSDQKISTAGMSALVIAFLLHGGGILCRVILGQRPPVSNFYETTLWLPFVGVAAALLFEWIYKGSRYFGLAAAILAFIALLLSAALPLDSSISPVVAVLRSNLWLTIHVLTIVASYGALTLATVLAHIYGISFLWYSLAREFRAHLPRPASEPISGPSESLINLELFLYRTIQVGVVLLASGIMLGGVWANASWGRYWGWDPKETWALITLLWFLAALHGRFAGWLNGIALALMTIGGFFLLLMTYYGVSFYLVGLHSYAGGHAKPIPPLLIGYLLAEISFMVTVGFSAWRRRAFTSG